MEPATQGRSPPRRRGRQPGTHHQTALEPHRHMDLVGEHRPSGNYRPEAVHRRTTAPRQTRTRTRRPENPANPPPLRPARSIPLRDLPAQNAGPLGPQRRLLPLPLPPGIRAGEPHPPPQQRLRPRRRRPARPRYLARHHPHTTTTDRHPRRDGRHPDRSHRPEPGRGAGTSGHRGLHGQAHPLPSRP